MENKLCPICKNEKPTWLWHKSSNSSDGLSSYCKDCSAKKKKESRASKTGYYRNEVTKTNESMRMRVLEHYGQPVCCKKCGYGNTIALTVDAKARSHKNSGPTLWKWLIKNKYPDGFEILCMNCREIKRNEERQQCLQTRCRLIARPS